MTTKQTPLDKAEGALLAAKKTGDPKKIKAAKEKVFAARNESRPAQIQITAEGGN